MEALFDINILTSMIRLATPILLATLGGILSSRAGILDISLEGQMIIGAFFAVAIAQVTGSVWVGVLAAALAGALLSLLFGFMVLKVKSNDIITGVAANLLAGGVATYMLKLFFGASGTFSLDGVESQSRISVAFLERIPCLDTIFNNHTPLVYFGLFMTLVIWVVLYKWPVGYNIRAVGEKPIAARTAGIKITAYQFGTLAWSGIMCGLGGAYLSTGSLGMFTEGMISGRGFMAFTAIVFGRGNPIFVMLASLLFGLADALSLKFMLTGVKLPTQLLQMFPYLLTVVIISVTSWLRCRRLGTLSLVAD